MSKQQNSHCQLITRGTGPSGTELHIHLPPGGMNILPQITQILIDNTGHTCAMPSMATDGRVLLVADVTDVHPSILNKAIEEIDLTIDAFLARTNPIKLTTGTDGNIHLEANVNLRQVLIEFQALLRQLSPLTSFLGNNGGWYDPKTNEFQGFDQLEAKLAVNDPFPEREELETALQSLALMRTYFLVGKAVLNVESL